MTYDPDSDGVVEGEVVEGPMPYAPAVYVPTLSVQDLVDLLEKVQEAKERVLQEGIQRDYAIIPGTGSKPSLLKPGAEKLCQLFGYRISAMDEIKETDSPYGVGYKCILHDSQGRVVGVCDGWADKTEPKARTWNKNTVMKMAQKRAFVGATLYACNASAIFTQDVEDYGADDPTAQPPIKETVDVTKPQTPEDAGASLYQDFIKAASLALDGNEIIAEELVIQACKDAGMGSTDDLVDPENHNAVRGRIADAIDELRKADTPLSDLPQDATEAAQEAPPGPEDTPGSLVLRRLVQEYGAKLKEEPMWECIKAAGINHVTELSEDGAYEMCATLIEERIELDEATKASMDQPPIQPGDASKAIRKPRAKRGAPAESPNKDS